MKTIAKIRLELSDWLYNAGIVGLAKILEANNSKVKREKSYIEFDDCLLEGFEEKYFNYFIDKYKVFTSWHKITSFEDRIDKFKEEDINDKYLKFINDKISYMKRILKSNSYKSGYKTIGDVGFDILKEEKNLKKISKRKNDTLKDIIPNVKEQLKVMKMIIVFLKRDEVKIVILAKNVIYDVIAKFWSNVSFLHRNSSKKNMYEEYRSYFLDYVDEYNSKDKQNYKYQCFTCDRSIKKLSKPSSYDLTWVDSVGVDTTRKTSHFWNFNVDSYICPICNLVYSCIPAGFTVLKGKGLFVNENSHTDTLIKINNTAIKHNTSFEELEEQSYYNIVGNLEQSNIENAFKEIENIQLVKMDSNNSTRPYTFNLLSKNKLILIYRHKKRLSYLINKYIKVGNNHYINLYTEVLRRLYNNQNQFDLIYDLIEYKLAGKFSSLFYVEQIIKINNDFLGGTMKGKKIYYKKIEEYKNYGVYLRNGYVEKGAKNKLGGITYRLLNALKTKDSARFMDTLINSYMYIKKSIPTEFVDALQDVDRFQTIGYSFVLGIQGQGFEEKTTGKNENNKEAIINE